MEKDQFGAFVQDQMNIEPTRNGLLDQMSFAVKDVFAVRGHVNSGGNPDWQKTHSAADKHAWTVERLLENGATLRGVTVTDELMYSLKGDNIHYPPTINPRIPSSFSGGSSSGSAVAAAAGLTDFAVGTDTGGSVRIPSSYCGLFGIRTTHGAIPLDGVIPLAPSFDTVGWMAKKAEVLAAVGQCLLSDEAIATYKHMYILEDAWDLITSETVKETLEQAVSHMFLDQTIQHVRLPLTSLEELVETFRLIQGIEAWEAHGRWIEAIHPRFGRDIAGRFEAASKMKRDEAFDRAVQIKTQFVHEMRSFVGSDSLLILPTTYGPAPDRDASFEASEKVRAQTMKLTCIAGVSGLPQVTIPVMDHGRPLGLSLISGAHTDQQLLAFVEELCRTSGDAYIG
ncbi:amidase [Sporolactobacillus kofuensis]|uniref:Amidase n=1 Tax=Sporolactobacillus kofuensis TaxID=269672 RepID=A0ABW1WAY5_9BACL|nr:amidase [Sporolactobacillus kofuensis]MCO7175024.1 amidase [Sporolactobacillus kofuensis]